jgi:hypothetical protein
MSKFDGIYEYYEEISRVVRNKRTTTYSSSMGVERTGAKAEAMTTSIAMKAWEACIV